MFVKDKLTEIIVLTDGEITDEKDLKLTDPVTGQPFTFEKGGCLYSPLAPGVGTFGYVSAKGGLLDSLKDLGSVYVFFDPPSATLPGFSAQKGGTQKQLIR